MRWMIGMAALALASGAGAQDADASRFAYGPVFERHGQHAAVDGADFTVPDATRLRHSFDVSKKAESGESAHLASAARFVNMHVANGMDRDALDVVVVVHGGATLDLLTDAARAAKGEGDTNPSGPLVRALLAEGVRVVLCGQSLAAHGLAKSDIIPGVELALSAMTAHAVLQQQGYSANPF